MKIAFGKYRGCDLRDVPDAYLLWLLESNRSLNTEIEREIAIRESENLARLSVAEQIIEAGYKSLALKLHPDAGGDHDAMVALNATREKLRRAIAQ